MKAMPAVAGILQKMSLKLTGKMASLALEQEALQQMVSEGFETTALGLKRLLDGTSAPMEPLTVQVTVSPSRQVGSSALTEGPLSNGTVAASAALKTVVQQKSSPMLLPPAIGPAGIAWTMDRTTEDITILWRECSVGLNGRASIKSVLESERFKAQGGWRTHGGEAERKFYASRMVIINQLKKQADLRQLTYEEAARQMERQRMALLPNQRSLLKLEKAIKQGKFHWGA